ncbi:hypothetical protein NQ317_004763 [Molorchus minor]|uniref:ATP-dependent DNA helicase n=1 Tax=Molorchus minor TaxID=1323400 RepID=A0ABQ9JFI9_9CUCU|nr:hypothetical protein NQ317_004763 [Molorchus minor]
MQSVPGEQPYRLGLEKTDFQYLYKLGQQYIVNAYINIEASRLDYIRNNQNRLRAEQYVGLADYIHRQILNDDEEERAFIGRMIVLPATFIGSPRAQQQAFQDAMAIVGKEGVPTLFITMTCNPKWREITENIPRGHQSNDHPMIVSRVFKCKFDEILNDLIEKQNFKKRGLPHTHILTTLQRRIADPIEIDTLICAEIPDDQAEPELYEIVTKNMIHGPCGAFNPNSPCCENGICSKGFPKPFLNETIIDENGRVAYRRRNDGRTVIVRANGADCELDNRWIVPYNRYTLLKYNCHINVECVSNINSVKYLYKYFFKSVDMALVRIVVNDRQQVNYNEIETFLNARYMAPPEAAWHILQFPLIEKHPHRLSIMRPLTSETSFEQQALDIHETTQLTAWFTLNQNDLQARQYLYTEIPLHYVWQSAQRHWRQRLRGAASIVVRLYAVNYRNQELYCLRLLLLHVRGALSFENLRSVDGNVCATFAEACRRRNLLANDEEWQHTLREACQREMPHQLRELFAYMLIYCEIANKLALWEEFTDFFIEDFTRRNIDRDQAIQMALRAIQNTLITNGTRLAAFGLPEPNEPPQNNQINVQAEQAEGAALRNQLNAEQLPIFEEILNAVNDDNVPNRLFYINAAAGAGKSFIFQTLLTVMRGQDTCALALAPTGIAASILKDGRTIHSRFRLPLAINETTTSGVTPRSEDGRLIRSAKLIIIDEISMVTRAIFSIINRALKDICNDNRPFANKVIVVGGDFRQTLPIVINGNRASIVNECVKHSLQVLNFGQYNLLRNVRVDPNQQQFSDWLLNLGNDTLPIFRATNYGNIIQIPPQCVADSKNALLDFCLGNLNFDEIRNRAILTPLNVTCDEINNDVIHRLPGEIKTYLSADSIDIDDQPDVEFANYPIEFLNTITPSGFPRIDWF